MARGGSRPNAGRTPGSRNKATIERQLVAAKIDAAQRGGGKPLGREVIEEMMLIAQGAAASFQPVSAEQVERAHAAGQTNVRERVGDMDKFGQWWDRTCYAAKELAKYQSPTFRAVMVSTPGAGIEQPKQIEGDNVIALNDHVGASRVYQNVMKAAAGGR